MKKSTMMVLSMLLARAGSAQTIDQTKLRSTIRLPEVYINYQFKLSVRNEGASSPNERIADLKKTLRGAASDAPIYLKIGDIYNSEPLNDSKSAQAAYAKGVALFRGQLRRQPANGWVMAQLGTGLSDIKQNQEAEKLLRKSVQVAPKDWRAWVELGKFIQNRNLFPFGGKQFHFDTTDVAALRQKVEAFVNKDALPRRIAQMQKASAEARADFDRAVQLNPNVPETYEARGSFRWIDETIVGNIVKSLQNKTPGAAVGMPAGALDDAWKAADLAPDDPVRQGFAVICEFLQIAATDPDLLTPGQSNNVEKMPAATQARIHTVTGRLQRAAATGNRRKAGVAASALTTIGIFTGNMEMAEQMAKHVLALNPKDEGAMDALAGVYVSGKRFQEFAEVQQARVKQEDTAYNHLVLAKIYDNLPDAALASHQVLIGVKRFPNDLLLNLAEVNVLLRQSGAGSLKQAERILEHAQSLYAKMSAADQKTNETNLNLARSAYMALSGKVDTAKEMLQNILKENADNQYAKDMMAALDSNSQ